MLVNVAKNPTAMCADCVWRMFGFSFGLFYIFIGHVELMANATHSEHNEYKILHIDIEVICFKPLK